MNCQKKGKYSKMFFYFCFLLVFVSAAQGAQVTRNVVERDPTCKLRNHYYPIDGSCDFYIECKDYVAREVACPDGLHFNVGARWPDYPCGYPSEVPCLGGTTQPALATADCPHEYGFFVSSLTSPSNCGRYRMCVEGRALEMVCPVGLAFNPASGRCDWPYLVPSCDTSAFLGFKCPAPPVDENDQPLDIVLNYRYAGDCKKFFSCELGLARLLSCDAGLAFDVNAGHCIDIDLASCAP